MSNKEYSTPTLKDMNEEVQRQLKNGYTVVSGPSFADGMYTAQFERNEVVVEEQQEAVQEEKPVQAPISVKKTGGRPPKAKA